MNWTQMQDWVNQHVAAGFILTLAATLMFVWWVNALRRWQPMLEAEIWNWRRRLWPLRGWITHNQTSANLSRSMWTLHRILIVVAAYFYLAFVFRLFPWTHGWMP